MKRAILVLSMGTDGGTGTLSIRIGKACCENDIAFFYCAFKDTNEYNTKELNAIGNVSIIADDSYATQFKALFKSDYEYTVLVYMLEDYYKAEILQKANPSIKTVFLYQVGPSVMRFSSPERSETRHRIKRFLARLLNNTYMTGIINTGNYLVIDQQCAAHLQGLLGIKQNLDSFIVPLPYSFHPQSKDAIVTPHKPFTISSMCRMDFPFKGYIIGLIKTFQRLKNEYKDLELVIVGDGPDFDEVKATIDSLPNNIKESVRLTGRIPYNNLKDVYEATSLYVGMGTTIIDACDNYRIAVVAAMNTYNLECESLFIEKPYSYGLNPGQGSESAFIDLFEYVYNLSRDEYYTLASKQFEEVSHIYDMDSFLAHLLDDESINYQITNYPLNHLWYVAVSKLLRDV